MPWRYWRTCLPQTRRIASRNRQPTCLSRHPQHHGIAHYLIHAYDNADLASRGLTAARAYYKIAPSAPHALHIPSHIFTRLGPVGGLHRLQHCGKGCGAPAGRHRRGIARNGLSGVCVLADWTRSRRYLVERHQWADAAVVVPPAEAPPHVTAIAVWARRASGSPGANALLRLTSRLTACSGSKSSFARQTTTTGPPK